MPGWKDPTDDSLFKYCKMPKLPAKPPEDDAISEEEQIEEVEVEEEEAERITLEAAKKLVRNWDQSVREFNTSLLACLGPKGTPHQLNKMCTKGLEAIKAFDCELVYDTSGKKFASSAQSIGYKGISTLQTHLGSSAASKLSEKNTACKNTLQQFRKALENKFVLVKPAWSTGTAILPKTDPKADSSGASGASPPPIEEDMDEVDDDSMVLAVPAQGEGPNSKLPLIQSTKRLRSGRPLAEPETPGAVINIDKELAEKEAKLAKLRDELKAEELKKKAAEQALMEQRLAALRAAATAPPAAAPAAAVQPPVLEPEALQPQAAQPQAIQLQPGQPPVFQPPAFQLQALQPQAFQPQAALPQAAQPQAHALQLQTHQMVLPGQPVSNFAAINMFTTINQHQLMQQQQQQKEKDQLDLLQLQQRQLLGATQQQSRVDVASAHQMMANFFMNQQLQPIGQPMNPFGVQPPGAPGSSNNQQ